MKALDYILANCQREKYKDSLEEREVLKALVHTLNKEELLILQKTLIRGSSKWSVGKKLCEEASKVLGKIEPQRNESIAALLKAFADKKGGKVTETRIKLRDRFSKQSFHIQRNILKAMLHASKQDRIWAFNRLSHRWDNLFFDDVKTLWEQYHEKESGDVIIKHFPMEYVYDNLSALSTQGNYTNICIKLIHHPTFQISKPMLRNSFVFNSQPEIEHLYILAKSQSKVEQGYATNLLFQQMVLFLNEVGTSPEFSGKTIEKIVGEKACSTKHFSFVRGILWCMGELGLVDELIAFEEWDNRVKYIFLSSEDLNHIEYDNYADYQNELWNLYRQTIIECLPSEYQQQIKTKPVSPSTPKAPIKEDILQNSPTIKSLAEKLDLEILQY